MRRATSNANLRERTSWRSLSIITVLALLAGLLPSSLLALSIDAMPAGAAPTSTLKLDVVSAMDNAQFNANGDGTVEGITKGDRVADVNAGLDTKYHWIINVDDSGDTTQSRLPDCMPNDGGNPQTDLTNYYPRSCNWPSTHTFSGGSAQVDTIAAQGTDADLNTTTGVDLSAYPSGTKFLISVTAPNFRIDGAHFSLPLDDSQPVVVGMQPYPLPLATLRIQVFEDTSTNGQFDPQIEHGLDGFHAHIRDVLAEVTTNWFGDPLCTRYDSNHDPIPGTGGQCVSGDDPTTADVEHGVVVIPDLGPNRYSAIMVAPDGQSWTQTTTLEGGLDWDTWPQEGSLGYNPDNLVGGAPIPAAFFGYVPRALDFPAPGTGHLTGRVVSSKSYLPPAGGDTLEGPVDRPWVAITDLGANGDPLVYVDRWNADGTFDIANVPPGTYQLAFWDDKLDLLLSVLTAVVEDGQTVDIGDFSLSHWFSEVHGTVFIDGNENGKQDPGEPGLAGQDVQLLSRENSIVDAGSSVVTTDANGHYTFPEVYPYGYWTVEQVYNDRFRTTGVTYQTDNQPTETTVQTAQVDVAMLNQDGLNTRLDWGLKPYATGTNGGIVGTVYYNETRNELDARLSATEDYEAGIPGLTVNLYATVKNPDGTFVKNADGSYKKGPKLNSYVTETFTRPTDCQARDASGSPLPLLFAAPSTGGFDCVESPLMGDQVGVDAPQVNGNYGFATRLADKKTGAAVAETPLEPDDYLVEVEVPNDATGKPKFQVSREEDINVFDGDQFAPQVPPPPCAGPQHTVDVKGVGSDGPSAVDNPSFADAGGSPYEGQQRPLCNAKLVTLGDRKSVAPTFSYFTDVPLPGRLFGAVVEDLALGSNPQEFYYGEKAGIPNSPIGVYDFSGRLVFNDQSDPNGFFEMLLPSTSSYNCPLPAGPCPGIYHLVGNDPGTPGHPNPNYDPQYRTMSTNWQLWPNLTLLADIALLPAASVIEIPGTQNTHPPACPAPVDAPQFFAVSPNPYGSAGDSFAIEGQGFGAAQGTGKVKLGGSGLTVTSWSDTHLDVTIPATGSNAPPPGPHQLEIIAGNGKRTVNALTFHVLGAGYTPTVYDVGPGHPYATIQSALEAAAASPADDLVVVHPNTPGTGTPLGDYFENIVVHSPVKLQGVGPGGVRADGTYAEGSIINALGFAANRATAWSNLVEGLRTTDPWADATTDPIATKQVSEGEAIYVLAADGEFGNAFKPAIDGFGITGADEQLAPEFDPAHTPFYPIQSGGIFVNAYARHLRITNNVLRNNGGAFAGAIRVGTPYVGDNHNDDVRIAHNRVLANGGTNLAGAIGLFAGSNGYEVDHNDICGNFSAEYGGGISHFGLSGGGATVNSIHHNRVYLNESYDEGAGVIIAGELPNDPSVLSTGSGPVDVHDNVLQQNLSNDDGGGLRFLMAGNFPINVFNNMIVNNVATHEGGGIGIDDAPDVRIYNNTVAKNVTTSTSAASAGNPAPAGLSTAANSNLLQDSLPGGSPTFSDPLLFDNIFWDNRAGSWDGAQVTGIGLPGDATPPNQWDMGSTDGSGPLTPTNSVLTGDANSDITDSPTNAIGDPGFVSPFDTVIRFLGWRGDPHFVDAYLVAADVPPEGAGNYHLANYATSLANNLGAASKHGVTAPTDDIDGDVRPPAAIEAGADQDSNTLQDFVGPVSTNLALAPATTGAAASALSAHVSDQTTGGNAVTQAEFFVDATGANGTGSPMTIVGSGPSVNVTGSVNPIALALGEGSHDVFVHGKDAAGNWGGFKKVTLKVDLTGPATTNVVATPNPTHSAASVLLTGRASDPNVGAGPGTRIAAAEYYLDVDPGAGLATAMNATDGNFNSTTENVRRTVNVGSLAFNSTHTLCVRGKDAVGNWGAAVCTSLVVDDIVFANSFEAGNTSAWSSTTGLTNADVIGAPAAQPAGPTNLKGLRVRVNGSNRFVQDNTPNNEAAYHARFYFNPNDAHGQHTILQGKKANGDTIFDVQYRRTNAGVYQVQLGIRRTNGSQPTTPWITITNASHFVELEWTSAAATTTKLRIDGAVVGTLTGSTTAHKLDRVRLGAIGISGGTGTYEYFDNFVSTRTTLIGP